MTTLPHDPEEIMRALMERFQSLGPDSDTEAIAACQRYFDACTRRFSKDANSSGKKPVTNMKDKKMDTLPLDPNPEKMKALLVKKKPEVFDPEASAEHKQFLNLCAGLFSTCATMMIATRPSPTETATK